MVRFEQLAEGSVLHDTYELLAPLGRGGMGTVWRAKHVRLPRQMALKVLNDSAYESEEVLQRFRREAEITSSLGHPHIVQVFDFNVLEDGRAYLVMELLQGESLRDRLVRGPMALAEAIEVVAQVGSALSRAHGAGIVHRDLKPENIFLCTNPVPSGRPLAKVLDFGISKIQGSLTVVTQDQSLLGTPKYMSPEQAKGENTSLDARTDQFALAAIAYEMVTGQPAFPGSNVTSVLLKVLNEEPLSLASVRPDIPELFDAAIRRGLAKDRTLRFPDVDAFVRALVAPLQVDTVEDTLASGSQPALRVPPGLEAPPAAEPTGPTAPSLAAAGMAPTSDNLGGSSMGGAPRSGRFGSPWGLWLSVGLGAVLASAALTGVLLWLQGPSAPSVSRVVAAPDGVPGGGDQTGPDRTSGPAGGPPSGVEDPAEGPPSGVGDPSTAPPDSVDRVPPSKPVPDPNPELASAEPDPETGGVDPKEPTRLQRPRSPRARPDPFDDLPPPLVRVMDALRSGRKMQADQLVVQAMGKLGRTPQAFAVATVVACSLKDLGKAKAYLANVPSNQRGGVKRRCRRHGLSL